MEICVFEICSLHPVRGKNHKKKTKKHTLPLKCGGVWWEGGNSPFDPSPGSESSSPVVWDRLNTSVTAKTTTVL